MPSDILHILNLDTIGGVEELFCNFIQYPTEHRHHVFVTGGKIHPHFEEAIYLNAASVNYEKYLFGVKIPKWIRKIRRDFVLSKNYTHIVLWNRFDKIESSAKVIYYEHGASWMHHKGKLATHFFDSVSTILANSDAAKKVLELKWGITKPITVIPNPLRGDIAIAKSAKTLQDRPIRLGCIGRLIPLKGFPLAIQALKELLQYGQKAELIIAGDGEERPHLERLCHGLPVTFLGPVKNVTAFYDSIDLLVIPSIREPLGLIALEAAARGTPVIAAQVDGLPEVAIGALIPPSLEMGRYPDFGGELKKLPDLVYNPQTGALEIPKLVDPSRIREEIVAFIDNPTRYQQASKTALEFAKSRESFADFAEKLLTSFT